MVAGAPVVADDPALPVGASVVAEVGDVLPPPMALEMIDITTTAATRIAASLPKWCFLVVLLRSGVGSVMFALDIAESIAALCDTHL